jgi:serine/threonine protein kinase
MEPEPLESAPPARLKNEVGLGRPSGNRAHPKQLSSSNSSLAPGMSLGPYRITGVVGAGAMGEVYRARDSHLNRDAALKVLPEVLARDPDRLARLRREAQVLASLNHQNIASQASSWAQGPT